MALRGRPRTFDRDEALGRAMEIFWAKGFEGASMNALIDAMGIGSPSLYAAFGSKEALFREAVDHYVAGDGSEIWKAVKDAATAYGAVEAFLMTTARVFSRTDRPSGCLITLSGLHANDSNEAWRAELIARRAQNTQDLARQLKKGVERGEIAPTADLEAIARFFVTVQQGMSIQARDGTEQAALKDIARAALAAWTPLTASR
ncbi:TetR/AcrR family transcriptional regulator [Glacieibacterium frigidum]|uniref:TetR/AcrR family transcriptional regulator n=2 Tax=Glacieibacterium frigidum TaxID=2593303 RepID=A0A552U8C3_9SPHN|nr:TetR/AcrR family transcriptional regulator [Glacieibacterium frigidum]